MQVLSTAGFLMVRGPFKKNFDRLFVLALRLSLCLLRRIDVTGE